MGTTIRTAVAADLRAIDAIYNEAVARRFQTADLAPMPAAERQAWFAEHQEPRYPVLVAVFDDAVIGYATLSPWRPGRAATAHAAELSYYVAGAHQGRGVGTALVHAAVAHAVALGHRSIFGIVIEGNGASIRLLEKSGFERWGCLPGVVRCHGEARAHLILGRSIAETPASEAGDD